MTFALHDEKHETDLDAFAGHFVEALRAEPWIVRVMDRSLMESAEGLHDVHTIAVPLLLNLEPAAFDQALQALEPARMEARLSKLRRELEAGSPRAEFELGFDPLGLVGPALQPLAGSFSLEQTRPLASRDGTLRLVLALTNQTDLGARACQEMMRRVEELKQRVITSWSGPAPEILVTGRTAYVGELSIKMRADVLSTLASSAGLAALVFWIGFRALRPLLAIMHVLLVGCVLAVGFGALIFRELNMITIGLGAILIGLGVDFGMVLYGIYEAEREAGHGHGPAIASALRSHARGVIFGALTTAAAFLCLLRSESTGFMQLGVLIAVGILMTAGLMMTLLFVLIGQKHVRRNASSRHLPERFVGWVYGRPGRILLTASALLIGLAAFACAPVGRVALEPNPRSLEPKHSRAGDALRLIQAKMLPAEEPIIVFVKSGNAQSFHDQWTALQAHWRGLQEQGLLKAVNSPAAFALSPTRLADHAKKLASLEFGSIRSAFSAILAREELQPDAFGEAFELLDALARLSEQGAGRLLDWRALLPEDSSWWFVLERFHARDGFDGAAYVVPARPLRNAQDHETISRALRLPGVPMHLSGWTYLLAELGPWTIRKLIELSAMMIGFNALLLVFLYRRFFPLLILFAGLALSVAALVATLKLSGVSLTLFNALAFPLVLGVGVDYGIYIALAMRAPDPRRELTMIVKPVLLSGLTSIAGFGSLLTAENPALRSLGAVCAIGIAWCLATAFLFILPACVWRASRLKSGSPNQPAIAH
ncbi:MAG: MMPL family transporter [Verrucomicrobiota bacterium]|nr:MMPL family transporter [Verrucomicrobiota bacterium]